MIETSDAFYVSNAPCFEGLGIFLKRITQLTQLEELVNSTKKTDAEGCIGFCFMQCLFLADDRFRGSCGFILHFNQRYTDIHQIGVIADHSQFDGITDRFTLDDPT